MNRSRKQSSYCIRVQKDLTIMERSKSLEHHAIRTFSYGTDRLQYAASTFPFLKECSGFDLEFFFTSEFFSFKIFSCSVQTEVNSDLNQKHHELNIEEMLKVSVKVSREDFLVSNGHFCFITAKSYIQSALLWMCILMIVLVSTLNQEAIPIS